MGDLLMDKAVILARGLGTRMQKQDETARLSQEQARLADRGVKAMMPIDRPFLDYVLTGLADAGYRRICLVVAPDHDDVHTYYTRTVRPARFRIDFAVQPDPLGTADAVAAAQAFAADDPFLVINSDNYYPTEALRRLRELDGPGLVGFERNALLQGSNIPPERITRFSVVQTDDGGNMVRIIEKPDQQTIDSLPEPVCVSMNCWRFGPKIFPATRAISPSPRGELELPDAVQYAIDQLSERFRVLTVEAPVLDLSSRSDVEPVRKRLIGVEVNL